MPRWAAVVRASHLRTGPSEPAPGRPGRPKIGLWGPAAAPRASGASSRPQRMWARPARAPVAAGPTFRHARVRRWCSARKTARRAPEGGEPCRARAAKPFCYDLGDGRAKRSRPSGVGQRRPTRSLLRWGGLGPPAQLPPPSIARRARWGTRPSLNPPPFHSQAVDLSLPTRALVISTPVERCARALLRTLAPQLALWQEPLCARPLYPPRVGRSSSSAPVAGVDARPGLRLSHPHSGAPEVPPGDAP